MSQRLMPLLLLLGLLGACSRQPPPATPVAADASAPKAGEPGAPQNAILTDAQIKALQKARAVEPQVLQQKEDLDKRIDADSGKD